MKKNCLNCHYDVPIPENPPCFSNDGCFYNEQYIYWKPRTNGDIIRHKNNKELASLLFAYQKKNIKLNEILEWLEEEYDI